MDTLKYFSRNANRPEDTQTLFSYLEMIVTTSSPKYVILNHPDNMKHPSALDIFMKYGVNNVCLKSAIDTNAEIPIPSLEKIKVENKNEHYFTVVEGVKNSLAYFCIPEKCWMESISKKYIGHIWPTHLPLIVDYEKFRSENNYAQKLCKESRLKFVLYIPFITLATLPTIAGLLTFNIYSSSFIYPPMIILISLLGTNFGSLFLMCGLAKYNQISRL